MKKLRLLTSILSAIAFITLWSGGAVIATESEDTILSGLTQRTHLEFADKSRERILELGGGEFWNLGMLYFDTDTYTVQTGAEGLRLISGKSDDVEPIESGKDGHTSYNMAGIGSVLSHGSDGGAVKVTFRPDDAKSDIKLSSGPNDGVEYIWFMTDNGSVCPGTLAEQITPMSLQEDIFYDVIIKRNGNTFSCYSKKSIETTYTQIYQTTLTETENINSFRLTSLTEGNGNTSTGITIKAISEYHPASTYTSYTTQEILGTYAVTELEYDFGTGFVADNFLDSATATLNQGDGAVFDAEGETIEFRRSDIDGNILPPFDMNHAIEFRLTVPQNSNIWIEMKNVGSTAAELIPGRLVFEFRNTYGYVYGGDGVNTSNGKTIRFPIQVGTPETYLLCLRNNTEELISNNGATGLYPPYAYDVYRKDEANGTWKKMASAIGLRQSGATSKAISFFSANAELDYVKVYDLQSGVEDIDAKTEPNPRLLYNENFNGTQIPTGSNLVITNGTSSSGMLNLSSGGSYTINDVAIPLGGYIEMQYQSDGETDIHIRDGNRLLQLQSNIKSTTVSAEEGKTKKVQVIAQPNIWQTYRILRNTDGTYTIYRRVADDLKWAHIYQWEYGIASTGKGITLEQTTGNLRLDYLRIYGPSDIEGLRLTDGHTLEVLDGYNSNTYVLNHPTELVAVVDNKNTEGTVLFIAYDIDGRIIKTEVRNAETDSLVFDTTQIDGIASVRAFLWKITKDNMIPLITPQELLLQES